METWQQADNTKMNTATIRLITEPLSPIARSRFSGSFHASPIEFLFAK